MDDSTPHNAIDSNTHNAIDSNTHNASDSTQHTASDKTPPNASILSRDLLKDRALKGRDFFKEKLKTDNLIPIPKTPSPLNVGGKKRRKNTKKRRHTKKRHTKKRHAKKRHTKKTR